MSKLIDSKKKTGKSIGKIADKSGSDVDPTNDCCTAPPDGDPGPIKP
jgi:hypothetical protein